MPKDDEELGWQIIHRVQSLSTVGKFLWPIPDKGLIRRIYRINRPTLVIVGDLDQVVPAAYAELLTSRIPDSRSHVMSDAGHMMTHERPDEFARVVLEFLSE